MSSVVTPTSQELFDFVCKQPTDVLASEADSAYDDFFAQFVQPRTSPSLDFGVFEESLRGSLAGEGIYMFEFVVLLITWNSNLHPTSEAMFRFYVFYAA